MSDYSLETGETLWRVTCKCCGQEKNRVMGLVHKNGVAHAKYYALLNVEEKSPRVGITVSVGPWWEGSALSERTYAHLDVRFENDGTHIDIRDPQTSHHYPWEKGGKPLKREQANVSNVIQEIRSVAGFIANNDPAISSYLKGNGASDRGRDTRQAVHPVRIC